MKLSTRLALAGCAMLAASLWIGGAEALNASADDLPAGSLRDSPSLYLRQAADSKIRWQQWGEPAFALARKLNRPLLIDDGAVWCHWCHVMDERTYADPRVADLINASFVPIKLDADVRPDIDGYYQAVAQEFSAGGWPLTCFADTDGAPFFIAGYIPAESASADPHAIGMVTLLTRVRDEYAKNPDVKRFARELAAKLASPSATASSKQPAAALHARILAALAESYDRSAGGFGNGPGPRFFDFPALELALAHGFFGHPDFTALALDSLRKIAAGGVFDQLGGGFHRYSTDSRWAVPHFEKLSYDQALALSAYVDACAYSHDQEFARVARAIVGYVNANLSDPSTPVFLAHQDADAFAGDDGSYYTWTRGEVERACANADDARAALLFFGFEDAPGLAPDGRVVLRRAMTVDQLAKKLGVTPEVASARLEHARTAMTSAREHRRHPQVDHAVLTDRNALMASAYLKASAVLDDPSLARRALADLDFLIAHLHASDGGYYHVWSNGGAGVAGLAADQVYLMNAFLDAYQVSDESKYLDDARSLAALIGAGYRDGRGLIVNHTGAERGAVAAGSLAGAQSMYDSPMPSAQAEAAIGFSTLAALTSDEKYARLANETIAPMPMMVGGMGGSSLGAVGLALEIQERGETVVAVAGDANESGSEQLLRAALAAYRPGKVVERIDSMRVNSGGVPAPMAAMYEATRDKHAPLAFVCAGTACANPSADAAALARTIATFGIARESPQDAARR